MNVKNTQRDRINSNCSPEELGRAIAGVDLASIPPEKRKQAITERLVEVMLATTDSTEERRKPNFQLDRCLSTWVVRYFQRPNHYFHRCRLNYHI